MAEKDEWNIARLFRAWHLVTKYLNDA